MMEELSEKIANLYAREDYRKLLENPIFERVLNKLMQGKIYELHDYEDAVHLKTTALLSELVKILMEYGKTIGSLEAAKQYFEDMLAEHAYSIRQFDERKGEIDSLNSAKQYFADTLTEQAFLIQQLRKENESLEYAKQYLSDTVANHSYSIKQLEDKCHEKDNLILKMNLKMNYLIDGDESSAVKVVQLVQVMRYGDAVGNYVLEIGKCIRQHGISCEIYADDIDKSIEDEHIRRMDDMPVLNKKDILIIHVTAENRFLDIVEGFMCKVVICYHNITPPSFFKEYDKFTFESTSRGLEQLKKISGEIKYCIADSAFNKQDLIQLGFHGSIKVIPLILHFNKYEKKPDRKILELKDENISTFLSVGRIVPNKKIEDIIKVFSYYKKNINYNSRLILAGKYDKDDLYYNELLRFIRENEISDVVFTGHITTEELNGYFKISDLYICMSEHEGFCVPLVEAMYFKLPIIAYNSTAVPGTLNGAGVLIDNKSPEKTAKVIDEILCNEEYREEIIKNQNKRLAYFNPSKIRESFFEFVSDLLEEE